MATTPKVLLKRSSVIGKVPVAGDLQYGELAINFADGRIYYKDANDAIKNFVDSSIIQDIVRSISTDSAEVINLIQTHSLDSSEIISLIDAGYVQARQDYAYSSLTGAPDIQGMIDSEINVVLGGAPEVLDTLNELAAAIGDDPNFISTINAAVAAQLDSAETIALIDSAHVRLRQDYAYASLTGVPTNVSQFANDANYLDSNTVTDVIDATYVQTNQTAQDFSYASLTGAPNVLDSADVSGIITSDVDKAFVDALNVDADTLDGQTGSWYVDWTNTTNKPVILDNVDVDLQIDARVDKSFLDALNIDADTVDGYHAQAFFDAIDSAVDALIDGAPGALDTLNELAQALNDDSNAYNNLLALIAAQLDSSEAIALIDSAHVQQRIGTTTNLPEGSNLYYTTARADSDFDVRLATKTTTDVTEGSNLYYTTARHDSDTLAQVDSAYIQARVTLRDSAFITGVIDSDFLRTTGGTLTGNLTIDGTNKIYFDDTNKYIGYNGATLDIRNSTGNLRLINNQFQLVNTSSLGLITADTNSVSLRYAGNTKLQTQTGGITVTGTINTHTIPGGTGTFALTSDIPVVGGAFLDSGLTTQLIDSTYVQQRQDYAYASLTGVPTNVSQFANDAGYLTDADTLDSAEAQGIIDSNFQNLTQSIIPANTTIDLGTLSNRFRDLYLSGSSLYIGNIKITDSNGNISFKDLSGNRIDVANIDSVYVQARQDYAYASLTGAPDIDALTVDSAEVIALVDSAYVQQRQTPQDFAYSSLTGAPTNVSSFTNDANYIAQGDSATLANLDVTGNAVIGGNLQVQGTTFTANTVSFSVDENLFYLNDLESAGSPTQYVDIGFSGNVNETGTYTHAGFFRDATDGTWQVFNSYSPEPDTAELNTAHASYTLAPFKASTLTGVYQGFDSDFAAKSTTDLTEGSNLYYTTSRADSDFDIRLATKSTTNLAEGSNLYYTKARVDSDITTSLNDSLNSVSITIDNTIESKVDSAYVLARVAEAPFLDSADAIALIDSAYVQARQTPQDFAYSSLTGAPTNVSAFTNDANYLDSSTVQGVIDAAYIQANQTTYDFLDSAETIALIDSAYILARSPAGIDSDLVIQIIDSAYVQARQSGVDSAAIIALVDSAYVNARVAAGTDSSTVSAIILTDVDSAYVQARQLNETAAPLTQSVYNFIATAAQTSFTGLSVDSDKFQVYLNGLLLPRADYTHNSTQVDLAVAADSGDVLEVLKFSGNDTGAQAIQQRHYIYTATSGQTVFTGADDNSATLSYTQGRINVYLNGLLLLDSADYTQNGDGDTVTFTSGVTAGHIVNIQTLTGNTGTFSPLEQILYEFTADSGQTIFTGADNNASLLDFSNDKITVYLNGILLSGNDYTSSSGNTITLDVGADSGNLLTVAKLSGNNIGLDSAQVNALIGVSAPSGVDSAAIIALVDSAYIQARQVDIYRDSAFITNIIDSDYIELRRPAETIFSLSGDGSNYVFTGDGFPSSATDPKLYLTRGKTYKFTNVPGSHPLEIRLSNGGSAYSDGVTNNGGSGTVEFTVPMNAPTSLVYQCTVHGGMVGDIVILDETDVGIDSDGVNVLINEYIIDTDTTLTTTTTDQVVDTFSASTYRTAKYIVQMSHSSGYHSNEILLVHDGSTVYMTTYAEVITASSLGTVDADINSGNVRLLVTPSNTNTDINVTRINVNV